MAAPAPELEHLLRTEAPQVLGALVRRFGHFDIAEDAVQEALTAAAQQWPTHGIPEHPRGWLIRVGYRRMVDQLRADQLRQRREYQLASQPVPASPDEPAADDSLTLLFLCCHPILSPVSQVALTLRAVGGLTTAEIAHASGVTEIAMGQRISRAKQQIRSAGGRFVLPSAEDRENRLTAVLQVLYLIFNEGYAATAGEQLHRVDLTTEAIRLTRMLHRLLPDEPEVAGLLALMLLNDARRPARSTEAGDLVTMEHQQRDLWDENLTAEGTALTTAAMRRRQVGPYQLQAAIAALHNGAPSYAETDWPQIATLYAWLEQLTPTPRSGSAGPSLSRWRTARGAALCCWTASWTTSSSGSGSELSALTCSNSTATSSTPPSSSEMRPSLPITSPSAGISKGELGASNRETSCLR
jgi:RNA polymerase sigma factor (sigma-70 family)